MNQPDRPAIAVEPDQSDEGPADKTIVTHAQRVGVRATLLDEGESDFASWMQNDALDEATLEDDDLNITDDEDAPATQAEED